jgi:hypothetical protein
MDLWFNQLAHENGKKSVEIIADLIVRWTTATAKDISHEDNATGRSVRSRALQRIPRISHRPDWRARDAGGGDAAIPRRWRHVLRIDDADDRRPDRDRARGGNDGGHLGRSLHADGERRVVLAIRMATNEWLPEL